MNQFYEIIQKIRDFLEQQNWYIEIINRWEALTDKQKTWTLNGLIAFLFLLLLLPVLDNISKANELLAQYEEDKNIAEVAVLAKKDLLETEVQKKILDPKFWLERLRTELVGNELLPDQIQELQIQASSSSNLPVPKEFIAGELHLHFKTLTNRQIAKILNALGDLYDIPAWTHQISIEPDKNKKDYYDLKLKSFLFQYPNQNSKEEETTFQRN